MSLLSRLAVQAARAYGILSSNPNNVSADYLVVAGGGGGGSGRGGGGGAGGMLTATTNLSILNTYSITVGAGGIAGTPAPSTAKGGNGNNSSIIGTGTSITSTGGGGGDSNGIGTGGNSGGSGGGGAVWSSGGAGTSGQGNAGGLGGYIGRFGTGGGGGASTVGADATPSGTTSGAGGSGTASSISGSSVTYAGGGGGGNDNNATAGAGGSGGGGAGNISGAGTAGTTNLGGGGGGGGRNAGTGTEYAGAAGGSGIVIISYTSATPKFVGGTITTSGGKQIHTFTSSGTLSPITPITASYLVVAGGGGGGGYGGGGAGGYQASSTTLYSGATYVVTVGGGGAGGASAGGVRGTQGTNTTVSGTGLTTLTSVGGGGGGADTSGGNGGSGGGAGYNSSTGGTATSGQGNNGGGGYASGPTYAGGAGGGAGAVGGTSTSGTAAAGGVGLASSISGTSTYYAGGGGGGGTAAGGAGGNGGGGTGSTGSSNSNTAGTTNTGGGGGGGRDNTGSTGGSGIVIISYAGSQVFNGGLVTSSGGNTIHTFTATGALTPLTNNLNNSLRFRSSASAYLNRTLSTPTNNKIWTWSGWVKRGALGGNYGLFSSASSGTGYTTIRFNGAEAFEILQFDGAAYNYYFATSQVFRDPSAWYHIVVAMDTTQATAANRMKLYVNGNQVTAFSSSPVAVVYPTQNLNTNINSAVVHRIGANNYTGTVEQPFDGYMTDINFIDGQALEPYYFGNNDANGVWKPIQYKGTYGTNGFYLTFGNTTSTTTLGYDSSPNGNNWTCNNISLTAGTTYDAMTDVPTNTSATVANYAVMNPIQQPTTGTWADGNLKYTTSGFLPPYATILPTSGKWYFEVTWLSGSYSAIGVQNATNTQPSTNFGDDNNGWRWQGDGTVYRNGVIATYSTYAVNDVIGIALDLDNGKLFFAKNNTWQNSADPAAGTNGITTIPTNTPFTVTATTGSGASAFAFNFGQRPFSYTPPTGFVALNTYNLPTPTILQGNKYMDATLYTGTGVSNTVVNQGQFKPDFVWIKSRSTANDHVLGNSLCGATQVLYSNNPDAELSNSCLTSFNNNGFSLNATGGQAPKYNANGTTYVGWQWQAGQGTTSSNTSGSITSTVSVNTTAGFSVVTYTGTGANATVGHGLGVAPKMIFIKTRSNSANWYVGHSSLTSWVYAIEGLNTTNGQSSQPNTWNSTAPTSTVFSLGIEGGVNTNTRTYVAYCWAEISGFSKFGSYTGNGSTDGPFVYTGMRPAWVLVKRTDTTGNWYIWDIKRNTFNVMDITLYPNSSTADITASDLTIDSLSNGFKLRGTSIGVNASGGTYIYAAFAENPFKNSNAR